MRVSPKIRLILLFLFVFSFLPPLYSEGDLLKIKGLKSTERKKQFWIYWGYNRAQYSVSNIKFTGPNYDFTLFDICAKDRATPFNTKIYFAPKTIWIPQYNYRVGYFISNWLSINFGLDHMKYVAVTDQMTKITGRIDSLASQQYAGIYEQTPIEFTTDFLRFEHTDGLNYLSTELETYSRLWKKNKQELNFFAGYGLGVLIPRSDVDLFNHEGANIFHLAGWGTSLVAGIRFDILPGLFVNMSVKGGFIHLVDIVTMNKQEKARQKFFFLQEMASVGYSLNYFNKKEKTSQNKPQ